MKMIIINMNLEKNDIKNVLKKQNIILQIIIIIVKRFVQRNILLNIYQLKNVLNFVAYMKFKTNYVF